MRSSLCTVPLVLTLALVPCAPAAAADASDERRGPEVGSLRRAITDIGPDSQGSTTPKGDPLSNGIAIGAAIGAATGLGLMAWAYAQCDESCDAPEPLPMYLMAGGVSAAAGAVVGLFIDKARKNTNQRVSVGGSIARARSHVRVTVAW